MPEELSRPDASRHEHQPLADFGARFRVEALIGKGGFGSVYSAHDQLLQTRVALKQLLRVEPSTILRFKREFRALADLFHPNLVKMHELFSHEEDWFFTMDLIDGINFRTYVRGVDGDPQAAETVIEPRSLARASAALPAVQPGRFTLTIDEGRLRECLAQLAAGVQALHDAGMLHRDLKPSNVLVTHAGRVKVLDFGLVAHLTSGTHVGVDGTISGTPLYMAPEQSLGGALSPASDWYSVGIMLYEVLAGRLPAVGGSGDLARQRLEGPPPDPRRFVTRVPDDLCDLVLELLRPEPDARPGSEEILRRLGARVTLAPPARSPSEQRSGREAFVGRSEELDALRAAYAQSRARAVAIEVRGPSGMGKSALIRQFLDEIGAEGVILEGRCYERESVPYKACDGVIDSLTQHLEGLSLAQAARLCPPHAQAIARLFPVLGRWSFIADANGPTALDPHELRLRAFAALRDLLGRIAAGQPLVVFIDDLQWGDLDSAALLGEVLAAPEPPRLLLLTASRPDLGESPMLESIRRRAGAAITTRRIDLGPLSDQDARALARRLLDSGGAEAAEMVVRESGRSPFFVHELTRALADREAPAGPLSLVEVVGRRIERVPPEARRVLQITSLAGGPIEVSILGAAVDLPEGTRDDAISLLHSAHLIRSTGTPGCLVVEPLHDRIRETALASLSPEAAFEGHRRLAAALVASGRADPEALALHFGASGDQDQARRFAEQAADRAADALAFDRAVALYERALTPPPPDAPRLLHKLADALANAGRGADAAQRYLQAAEGLEATLAVDLRRRAAEQLLRSGHVDEGLEVIRAVLPEVGMKLPGSPARSLASLLMNRLRLRVRGQRFTERAETEVDPAELRAIDICWSVGNGLGGVDLLQGADFQARHLLLALEAGEPYRIARALAWEAILSAVEGGEGIARAVDLSDESEQLAQRIAHPHAMGWAAGAAAVTAWCEGRWRDCSRLCEYATALFRERCADIAWELGSLEIWFNLPSLFFRGEIQELSRRAPACANEAEGRGDLYAETTVRTYALPLLHLWADRPSLARAESSAAVARFAGGAWYLQHWADLLAHVQADLYEGLPEAALERFGAAWPTLERTAQLRTQNIRMQARYWRARAAIGAAARLGGGARRRRLAEAQGDADRLVRERSPWGDVLAASLSAGLEGLRNPQRAAQAFDRAAAVLEELEMPLFALAHRYGAARLRSDEAAAVAALARITEAGAASPRAVAAWLAPLPLDPASLAGDPLRYP